MSSRHSLACTAIAAWCGLALSGCSERPAPPPPAPVSAPAKPAPAVPPLFDDATGESGIAFRHVNGRTGHFYYPEIIGAGVAILDYDNDGRYDILAIQGGELANLTPAMAKGPCGARLYHNELVVNADGTRSLRFTDVTQGSGLCTHGYGMGVAVGDYDNDGCIDVFVTYFGAPSQLFHNNCNGTFTDVTRKAGVAGNGRWGASATFFDYDRDGRLDLFVVNYVD